MKLKNKNVLIYGMGASGRAVAKVLQEKGARISFFDDNVRNFDQLVFEHSPKTKKYDLVVVSPGIKVLGNDLIEHFEKSKIPVMSELDFGFNFCHGRVIGITGTNGKTTVSMLVYKILRLAGFETFLCGNIGLPITSIAEKTSKASVIVCEVSNFQLELSKTFHPNVATVLNIKPDHLDRHGSFEEYVSVKSKIKRNMKREDLLVLNLDDDQSKKLAKRKNCLFFSKKTLKKGVFVQKEMIFCEKTPVISVKEIPLKGEKNLENVLAAISICSFFKVSAEVMKKAIKDFSPAAHRMEIVGEIGGVTFVDDSKATNVASTIACVEAFKDKSVILLMGGLGKDIDYGELFSLEFPIKKVICFGEDGKHIFGCAKNYGYGAELFEKFDEAVSFATEVSLSGDVVALSPACASFDEFSSYAERGERFKSLILEKLNGKD